jgi:hypothetical protein
MADTTAVLQLLEETETYPGADAFRYCGADQVAPEADAGTVTVAVPVD